MASGQQQPIKAALDFSTSTICRHLGRTKGNQAMNASVEIKPASTTMLKSCELEIRIACIDLSQPILREALHIISFFSKNCSFRVLFFVDHPGAIFGLVTGKFLAMGSRECVGDCLRLGVVW